MSPRDLDELNCKEKYPNDPESLDFTPSILHKKHRVIKLVKSQLQSLAEEELPEKFTQSAKIQGDNQMDAYNDRDTERIEIGDTSTEPPNLTSKPSFPYLRFALLLFIIFLSLLFAAAWLSAGPLSNRTPHTPVPWNSLIYMDDVCELEKKYLLRWSTSNYLE